MNLYLIETWGRCGWTDWYLIKAENEEEANKQFLLHLGRKNFDIEAVIKLEDLENGPQLLLKG